MFHPEVIAAREHQLLSRLGDAVPGGKFVRTSIEDCWAMRDRLAGAVDRKGRPLRTLTPEENTFITHQRMLCVLDYQYWLERYAIVAKETQDAEPLTPLWASQELFLSKVATLEYQRFKDGHPDGVLVNTLKARQLGISTLTATIVAHRAVTQKALRALVAADVQTQTVYLMSMAELVIDSLPWWLRPPVSAHQRGDFLQMATGTTISTAWGKSSRGGLMERDAKAKGNIGRGRTYGCVFLSEFSTWERPEQIQDGLLPGIPTRPRTFVNFESTAKGRYDEWHKQWLATAAGNTRFINIFIPWYIEPDKYWLPPTDGWEPEPATKQHAESVERTSGFYTGRTIHLSREQLFWYERSRANFDDHGDLYKFYEEYPATPEEAFQYAGRSIFPSKVHERLKSQERAPVAVVYIEPASDVAQLQAWERQQPPAEPGR